VRCSELQRQRNRYRGRARFNCRVLQCVAVCCSVLQCAVVCRNELQ